MAKSSEKPSEQGSGKKTGEKIPQKSRSKGKTAKQIMKKHIQNIDDVITDEDFKNLDIDLETSKDKDQHSPLQISNDPQRPKDEDKDAKVVTPWDVISE